MLCARCVLVAGARGRGGGDGGVGVTGGEGG